MELNAEQIKKQMQEWCDNMCENACLKGESLNGKIHTCEICFPNTVKNALALIKELTGENERLMREKTALECIVSTARNQAKADTVRKMQEAFEHRIHSKLSYHGWYIKETVIPEIAKDMLEGKDGANN